MFFFLILWSVKTYFNTKMISVLKVYSGWGPNAQGTAQEVIPIKESGGKKKIANKRGIFMH